MIKVSVIGATGYTGAELVRMLSAHKNVEISCLVSESSSGKAFSELYPNLRTICDLRLSPPDYDAVSEKSDAVFLCLPHSAGMGAVEHFYNSGKAVFDLSADFRFNNSQIYENAYNTSHLCPYLMEKAVYGLAEVNFDEISKSRFIAVPGCYPTSVLIPLIPLLGAEAIDKNFIIADSKSGVSGAGKKPSAGTHYCEINENFKPYGIFSHRHKPEMDHIIKRFCGSDTDIVFTPHLVPMTRGMLSTIYTESSYTAEELKDILKAFYKEKRFVRVIDDIPAVKNVAGTNFIDISVFSKGKKTIIISALDNLLKGASGQAVQCFNISKGLIETEGIL